MKTIIFTLILAAVLWFFMFVPLGLPYADFWLNMVFSVSLLAGIAILRGRRQDAPLYTFKPRYLLIGIGSAAALYFIFWLGNFIARFLFSFAGRNIADIYAPRWGVPLVPLACALLWIGAAEEIFWRGFIQRGLIRHYSKTKGYLVASFIYAAVHIVSLNLMLFLAALICGLFWGWMLQRYKSLWPVIISHALWDIAVFVLLPLAR